jgi:hypothetical protein
MATLMGSRCVGIADGHAFSPVRMPVNHVEAVNRAKNDVDSSVHTGKTVSAK